MNDLNQLEHAQYPFDAMVFDHHLELRFDDGRFRSESFGEEWYAGPTAVLEADNFTVVVSSRGVNLYDRSFFYAHGQG